jgi:UDP-glucose 4-epimerase
VTTAIVTGGTGFVGANLARRLLRAGVDVHLFVRPGFARWRIEEIQDDVRLHVVDLGDAEVLARSVALIQPRWVFHLAAYGAYSTQTDVDRIVQTNLIGTINLVNACIQVGCDAFVNAGSSSEYGFKDHAPSEREWLEPNSDYAWSKAAATLFCRLTAQRRAAPIITLRLYSVYGPYEEPTRLMPTIIARGLRGELPPLVNPDIARDYVYIDDVCEAFVLTATTTGQELGAVYNVGTGVQTSLRDVVDLARRQLRIHQQPVWGSMPGRIWDTPVWVADSRAIRAALGWYPRVDVAGGFGAFVEWLRRDSEVARFYISTQS